MKGCIDMRCDHLTGFGRVGSHKPMVEDNVASLADYRSALRNEHKAMVHRERLERYATFLTGLFFRLPCRFRRNNLFVTVKIRAYLIKLWYKVYT